VHRRRFARASNYAFNVNSQHVAGIQQVFLWRGLAQQGKVNGLFAGTYFPLEFAREVIGGNSLERVQSRAPRRAEQQDNGSPGKTPGPTNEAERAITRGGHSVASSSFLAMCRAVDGRFGVPRLILPQAFETSS
jgi:hypothetical protein